MNDIVLDIKNLSFEADKKKILNKVSFSARTNEFSCIIGPNGAGKSTLLKTVIRIIAHSEGEIHADGKNISKISQKELGKIISYVPQNLSNIAPFNVYEFIGMSRYPYNSFNQPLTGKDRENILSALKAVDLSGFEKHLLTTLSGGELQRVMIAAALVQETRILLLDEPFAAQDPHHQEEIYSLLKELKNKLSLTIICVCHDLNIALRLSDRIIALREGEIIFDSSPDNFIKENIVRNLYKTDFLELNTGRTGLPLIFAKGLIDE